MKRFVEGFAENSRSECCWLFSAISPKDENDLNDKISAVLFSERGEMRREHPAVRFALAHAVPDHSTQRCDVFIETKYIKRFARNGASHQKSPRRISAR
jgi:hypothetical protein